MGAIILWSNITLYYIQYFCCRLHIRSLIHKAHIPTIWMTYGVSIVRIWEKIDCVITREHCIKLLSHHGNSGPKDDSMFGMHNIESDPCRQSRGCVIWSGVASELIFTLDNSLGFVNGYQHNTISACQNVLFYNKMLLHDKNIARTWGYNDMERLSTLLAFCEWNLMVTNGFPHRGSVMHITMSSWDMSSNRIICHLSFCSNRECETDNSWHTLTPVSDTPRAHGSIRNPWLLGRSGYWRQAWFFIMQSWIFCSPNSRSFI